MQLICRHDIKEFATWKSNFDNDSEGRMAAGLSVLQIWRDADHSGRVWLLYEVSDRKRAQAFLTDARAEQQAKRAGVTATDCHFVETL